VPGGSRGLWLAPCSGPAAYVRHGTDKDAPSIRRYRT
jgi:hypothetical protein